MEQESPKNSPPHKTHDNYVCVQCGPHLHRCFFCDRMAVHDVDHCGFRASDVRIACDLCLLERGVSLFPKRAGVLGWSAEGVSGDERKESPSDKEGGADRS